MKTISRALVGTLAGAAVLAATATPAAARHDRDGINAGEVIAGALVLGGIAAVIASAGKDRNRDRDYRDRDYDRHDDRYEDRYDDRYDRVSSRQAVEMCVRAAERRASRYSYGGRADVTDIRDISRVRGGFEIRGRIAVNSRGRDWNRGDDRYGRGWDGDYRGWDEGKRGYDSGRFSCTVRHGEVTDIDLRGLSSGRGW